MGSCNTPVNRNTLLSHLYRLLYHICRKSYCSLVYTVVDFRRDVVQQLGTLEDHDAPKLLRN